MGITPTDFIDDLLAALMNSAEIDAQRFSEPPLDLCLPPTCISADPTHSAPSRA
jgi:hypothetical protein